MTDQRTVAARDCKGKLFWFPVDEAERWSTTTLVGCELYRVAGSWVLLDLLGQLTAEPGRLIDDDAALEWLLLNGTCQAERSGNDTV